MQFQSIQSNSSLKIPIKNTKKIKNIPETKQSFSYFKYSSSIVKNYNTNKKYAKYISEYIIWLYSGFVRDRNIKEITKDENILDFFEKFVEIRENYKYDSSKEEDGQENDYQNVVPKLTLWLV